MLFSVKFVYAAVYDFSHIFEVDFHDSFKNFRVNLAEFQSSLMELKVTCSSTEEGRGTEPRLQIDKQDEECHLLQLAFLVPGDVYELMLQQGKL